ncbi:aminotransferase class I/II-fold pyridoxal phosphate-dependent enzyme [Sinorhizobium sp. RAC02]|uniref:aminotransferase class I/II-fold pyridoxal phosphate-dependent enzyme n=1 Tax=Sinorhizobium sp. RAC02 TaxID=1842534 RepID=UPI000856B2B6|nr:aminotransferase class I/II-fold pyridoxal phosphate-dependent enzyme [Sinorhizobium sp. RAC02]AOF92405.1 cys/Met metabolism PLP-dependent enzyme family protein [Sinorhizobium sp. RAC02]
MGSNENPYGTSPAVGAALWGCVPSRYSDPASAALRGALSEKLGVALDRLVCGNGSEELIAAVCRAYLEPGDRVLTVSPCFGLHEIEPLAAGAQVVKVPMTEDLDFDFAALVAALAEKPKIFFISSPSNPVGRAMSEEALSRLIAATQPGTLFVLDEAYFEFIEAEFPDGFRVLAQRAEITWAVLRTFSKAYGLAGLRVGYAVTSDASVARAIRATLTPFNVNAAAQAAAVAALGDTAWMRETTAMLRRDREILATRIRGLGLRVIPSQANFLFIDVVIEAWPQFAGNLASKRYNRQTMDGSRLCQLHYGLTIGTTKDIERFAQELGSAPRPPLAATGGGFDRKSGAGQAPPWSSRRHRPHARASRRGCHISH